MIEAYRKERSEYVSCVKWESIWNFPKIALETENRQKLISSKTFRNEIYFFVDVSHQPFQLPTMEP